LNVWETTVDRKSLEIADGQLFQSGSFQMLKRKSSFGYLGYVSSDAGNVSYRVPDSALYDMEAACQYGDPCTLNMEDFAA